MFYPPLYFPIIPNDKKFNVGTVKKDYNFAELIYDPFEAYERGNIWKSDYRPYLNYHPLKLTPKTLEESLLLMIQVYAFNAHEMNLYLDIYPSDSEAGAYFKKMNQCYQYYMNEYLKEFGPLTISQASFESGAFNWIVNKGEYHV